MTYELHYFSKSENKKVVKTFSDSIENWNNLKDTLREDRVGDDIILYSMDYVCEGFGIFIPKKIKISDNAMTVRLWSWRQAESEFWHRM